MIKTIELTNFRQHEDLRVNLTQGLNIVRGANESGKSHLIEGALYAMYGSDALHDTLEETVTWGKDLKTLKASVTFTGADGEDYTFTRSKTGAEVSRGGAVFVTGQKPVSAFAAELLGADVKVASQLMLAGQNGLRGVLEEGPKATSQTIENLANFELFDKILDAAAEKLLQGSSATHAARLELLQAQVQALPVTAKPDEESHANAVAATQAQVQMHTEILDMKSTNLATVRAEWSAADTVRQQAAQLRRDIDQNLIQANSVSLDLAKAQDEASEPMPDTSKLEQQIALAADRENTERAKAMFMALPKVRSSVNRQQWEADVATLVERRATTHSTINALKADNRVLEAKRISASVCGLCGKDVSELPEVAAKNATLDAEINANLSKVEALLADRCELDNTLAAVERVLTADANVKAGLRALGDYVTVDDKVIPVAVTWARGEVEDGPALSELQGALGRDRECQKRILAAQARRDAHQSTLAAVNARVVALQEQVLALAPLSDDDFHVLEEKYQAANDSVVHTQRDLDRLKQAQAELEAQFNEAVKVYTHAQANRQILLDQVAQLQGDIATLEFNNTLIRKVRNARPVVANKLWNMVLSLVSQLFTRMRGTTSVVTRGKDGFLVNGHTITGLSGSAKDILGLAVRTALVRTFIPNCSLMVLDEPAAACDESRATALLGFVASIGFDQTILITHEEVSETFADNLIQL